MRRSEVEPHPPKREAAVFSGPVAANFPRRADSATETDDFDPSLSEPRPQQFESHVIEPETSRPTSVEEFFSQEGQWESSVVGEQESPGEIGQRCCGRQRSPS